MSCDHVVPTMEVVLYLFGHQCSSFLCYVTSATGGRILEDNGAWFRDEFQWHNGLEKLYEQIIGEYECGSSSRLRRSTGLT